MPDTLLLASKGRLPNCSVFHRSQIAFAIADKAAVLAEFLNGSATFEMRGAFFVTGAQRNVGITSTVEKRTTVEKRIVYRGSKRERE